METNSVSRKYETRRSTRAKELIAKSRVDWSRTKRSRLLDSDEEDDDITSASEKEIQTSSEDEVEEKGEPVIEGSKEEAGVSTRSSPVIEPVCVSTLAEDTEEESIVPAKRKRPRATLMCDSDGSDDSCIVRKVFAKRNCIIDEEDSPAIQEQHRSPEEEATERKQKRLMKLQELCRRRSTVVWSDGNHQEDAEDGVVTLEDYCPTSCSPTETIDLADDDSMKNFIVEEEEEEDKELEQEKSEDDESQPQERKHAISSRSLLEHYVPHLSRVRPYVHMKRIVRAFLINAVDDTFLISLYEGVRQKRYAQEMLTSLRYLDDQFIQPRLNNLYSTSRWRERYKKRVDSYPDVCIILEGSEERSCEACELQRCCTRKVILSGKLYNSKTMEIDDFMSHDEQILKVGGVCGNRTQVYHNLKHFKYKLYQDCYLVMKKYEYQDEPLKDIVDRVFSQLDEDGWIRKHYTDLKRYLDDADDFHEEKMEDIHGVFLR